MRTRKLSPAEKEAYRQIADAARRLQAIDRRRKQRRTALAEKAVPNAPAETLPANPPALLTLSLIRQHYVPAGERTLHRWVASGVFPKPDISMGGKVRWWKRETIEAWIASQVEGVTK